MTDELLLRTVAFLEEQSRRHGDLLALAAAEEVVTVSRALGEDKRLASALLTFATRLVDSGRANDAGPASEEAVERLPGDADALGIRALALLALDRPDEALRCADAAVATARAGDDPPALARALVIAGRVGTDAAAVREAAELYHERDEPALANALCVEWEILRAAGRDDEALAALEEAIEIQARLAATDPDRPLGELADVLTSRYVHLRDLERHAAMVAAIEDGIAITRRHSPERVAAALRARDDVSVGALEYAVSIYRELALHSDLADALSRQADALQDADQSLAAGAEAAALLRSLGADADERLAWVLRAHALLLADRGRHDDALTAHGEALATLLRVASANSRRYAVMFIQVGLEHAKMNSGFALQGLAADVAGLRGRRGFEEPEAELARVLHDLATALVAAGLREDAITNLDDAIELYRALRSESVVLVHALQLRTGVELDLGRPDDALSGLDELVPRCRAQPGLEYDLRLALRNRAQALMMVGRAAEAIDVAREAAELHRGLPVDAANCLLVLSGALITAGRPQEALAAADEAIALVRPLAEGAQVLGNVLTQAATALAMLGDFEEAHDRSGEAVRLLCARVGEDQHAALAAGRSLHVLASTLTMLERPHEAVVRCEEAVGLLEPLVGALAVEPELARAHAVAADCLVDLERPADALVHGERAVALYRELSGRGAVLTLALGMALHVHGIAAAHVDRDDDAVASLCESTAVLRELPDAVAALAAMLLTPAELCVELERHEEALAELDLAIPVLRGIGDDTLLASALELRAVCCGALGRPDP